MVCHLPGILQFADSYTGRTSLTGGERVDLHSGAGDGVEDVGHGAAAREVVHRSSQSRQYWPQCLGTRGLLYCLPKIDGAITHAKVQRILSSPRQAGVGGKNCGACHQGWPYHPMRTIPQRLSIRVATALLTPALCTVGEICLRYVQRRGGRGDLVDDVPNLQVRHDQHAGSAGHLALPLDLGPCNLGVHSCIILREKGGTFRRAWFILRDHSVQKRRIHLKRKNVSCGQATSTTMVRATVSPFQGNISMPRFQHEENHHAKQ